MNWHNKWLFGLFGIMKDYYKILGVSQSSEEDEIRKNYRKLAMQYHPDRNPDVADAEEKFKELAEAYGVLTDPIKRREYDVFWRQGQTNSYNKSRSGGFSYSQEDILQDLFKDPNFQKVMMGLLREFQRSGFRSNPTFLRNCLLGGRGGFFFGGLFFLGAILGPTLINVVKRDLSFNPSFFNSIGHKLGSLLGVGRCNGETEKARGLDIIYHLHLTLDELEQGKWIQVAVPVAAGQELLKVKIPAGSLTGCKLRMPGKGRIGTGGRGDLFLFL